MSKITRSQLKLHKQAEQLLWGSDKRLTHDEVAFCLEHWDPRALSGKHVAKNQAYFTPYLWLWTQHFMWVVREDGW